MLISSKPSTMNILEVGDSAEPNDNGKVPDSLSVCESLVCETKPLPKSVVT